MRKTYTLIFALLDEAQRKRFVGLIALMLAMAILDLAGVASVLPFLAVLANPGIIEERQSLSWLYETVGFESTHLFLQFLGVLVFILVMLSIAVRALTFYLVTHFARSTAMTFGMGLLKRYLARPYEWFLAQHSADLGQSLLDQIRQVVTGSVGPAVRLIANAIVLVFLLGLLLYLEPIGAVAVGSFFLVVFALIHRRLRDHLLEIGEDRTRAVRERYQVTAEAMGGIKEVKILGLEDVYVERFLDPSDRLARHQAAVSVLGELPRYVLEALAFGGMLLFVLYLLWSHSGSLESVLPILGAFAFAALKLMPTVQFLFRDWSQVRFGHNALEALHRELAQPLAEVAEPHPDAPRPRLRRALRLEDVVYRYPGAAKNALDGISLEIPAGTSAGFMGSTGAGKTTAIDVVLGLLWPQSGRLTVDGTAIDASNVRAWQREIGYVPQFIYLVSDTIAANIAFGVPNDEIDLDAVATAARLAKLDNFVQGLPEGYQTQVGEHGVRLSGGQRQRIGIARALYRDPDIIVFDEATSALDAVTERAVIDAVKSLHGQKTILMITHRGATIAHCDRIFMLRDGRLAGAGDYQSLSADNAAFRSLVTAAE